MKKLADAGMQQGAWGMSTGLQYVPGAYAETDELVAMSREIAKHGGIYASHIRDEGDELLESIEEVIADRRSGEFAVSHFALQGQRNAAIGARFARPLESSKRPGRRD